MITPERRSAHWQMPPQSAPPWAGSHESLGSSTQLCALSWHWMPAMPPQNWTHLPDASGFTPTCEQSSPAGHWCWNAGAMKPPHLMSAGCTSSHLCVLPLHSAAE